MKSMLHEASSVLKAIEKAWNESGKPAEFTIKILEKGEKNFLGLSKRPAIVSITYGSNVGFDKAKNRDFNQPRPFKKPYNEQIHQQVKDQGRDKYPQSRPVQQAKPVRSDDFNKATLQSAAPQQKRVSEKPLVRPIRSDVGPVMNVPVENDVMSWNDEMVNFCTSNLQEILSILNVKSSFTTKINNRNLVVTFDKSITSAVVEDAKSFFAGLAHILMQFLKKKHKKRFKGFQIIINTTASNEQSNPIKPN